VIGKRLRNTFGQRFRKHSAFKNQDQE